MGQLTTSSTKPDALAEKRFLFMGKRSHPDPAIQWETVARIHVKLTKIRDFGFFHLLDYTKEGVPKEYIRWGFICLNSGSFYRVAVETIRELQDLLGERCQIVAKNEITSQGNGKPFSAIDWLMQIKGFGPDSDKD